MIFKLIRMNTDHLLKKVLLVETDAKIVFLVSTVFKSYNIELIVARNGMQAMMYLNLYTDIELVLLDLYMPDIPGKELLNMIKIKYDGLPIVAHSNRPSLLFDESSWYDGFDDTLFKPYIIDDLIDMVAKFVRLKEC